MIVSNMRSSRGNDVPNQFVIESKTGYNETTYTLQSYKSIICKKVCTIAMSNEITLDSYYWNYSRTTSKYLSLFLNSSTIETKKRIKDGTYTLANLN